MKIPCPSCPDGNEWNSNGPTGRACPVCQGCGCLHGPYDDCIGLDDADSPYCECGNDPTEEESAENQCAACGKPLEIW